MYTIEERTSAIGNKVRFDVIRDDRWLATYDSRILAERHVNRGEGSNFCRY